jgi:hypothetical protein
MTDELREKDVKRVGKKLVHFLSGEDPEVVLTSVAAMAAITIRAHWEPKNSLAVKKDFCTLVHKLMTSDEYQMHPGPTDASAN